MLLLDSKQICETLTELFSKSSVCVCVIAFFPIFRIRHSYFEVSGLAACVTRVVFDPKWHFLEAGNIRYATFQTDLLKK